MLRLFNTILFFFFVTISYGQALSGSYTIGNNASDDFATLQAAVSELEISGVNGPVVFGIQSGTYTVSELIIPTINGTSTANTIRFQPLDSNGVVTLQSSTHLIKLERSNHITFDGLTFELTSDNVQYIGLHIKGAEEINVINCIFIAPNNKGKHIQLDNLKVFSSNTSSTDYSVQHVQIENNVFSNGNVAIFSNGISYSKNNYVNIINNVFEGKSGVDILIYFTNDIYIKKNIFTGERTDNPLQFRYIEKNFEFSGNQQYLEQSNNSPLYIMDCQMDNSSPMVIKNNFFRSYSNNILIQRSSNLNILNNSFYHESDSNSSTIRFTQNLMDITVNNNIFFRTNSKSLIYFSNDIDLNEFDMDYNCYYTPDNTNEFIQGATSYDFESWKTISNHDTNSILAKPNFISSNDLHLNNDVLIDGKGKVLQGVTNDIDGEVRNETTPDIGADEFDLDQSSLVDIEIESLVYSDNNPCLLLQDIVVSIKNNSAFPITSYNIEWWLFNNSKGKTTINESINPSESKLVNLGAFTFIDNTDYNLRFEISNPNETLDNNLSNNELIVDYSFLSTLEIYKELDECNNEYTLYIKGITNNSIIWSTGESSKYIKVSEPGTYSVSITNSFGCTITKSVTIN
ncbi:hypothetical protein [uncultured Algibacter sp.]|uniref:hypothetical protein n=1 Tax=uncultured Algibacter sp. TaxID=298659 RepID=UPI00260D78FC|nr:hypothetical protein [uncultured Algibacter sp.]